MVRLAPCVARSLAASLASLLLIAQVRAEDVLLGSVRLRGGIDANPTLLPGGRASAFGGLDGAFAAGREQGNVIAGVTGEVSRIDYANAGLAPSENVRLTAKAESTAFSDWTLRASASVGTTRTATLRASDLTGQWRAQWSGAAVHPFVSAELQYASLNEINAILSDFLPDGQRTGRATVTPGASVPVGDAEFGASVSLSATRYADRIDLFGFRRDNERAEPFLFARYRGQGLSIEASVSRLYGRWHDEAFAPVRQTLYDVSLQKTAGAWTLELAASRYAGETTFPISPLTISSIRSAKLTWSPDDAWSVGVLARSLHTAYLDSPYASDTLGYGVTAAYSPAKDWTVGLDLLRIEAVALNGVPVNGGLVSLSVSRKFSRDAGSSAAAPRAPRPWAAEPPPMARPRPGLGSGAVQAPYQPP